MQGFFKTLIRPDREEDPERTIIARAANVLQIGEFQLLQLAYHASFGEDLHPVEFDRLFAAYMLQGQIPSWGRQYATAVLELNARGQIDPDHPSYHRYDHNYIREVPEGVRKFTIASLVVFACVFGSIAIGHIVQQQRCSSVVPPFCTAPSEVSKQFGSAR
ncbi:MAG: hypothetical protein QNJ92_03620 [Alphaproteobacteria bacterium]|nr:hypothetical protein [Alphaproteobacteria bacterium]